MKWQTVSAMYGPDSEKLVVARKRVATVQWNATRSKGDVGKTHSAWCLFWPEGQVFNSAEEAKAAVESTVRETVALMAKHIESMKEER